MSAPAAPPETRSAGSPAPAAPLTLVGAEVLGPTGLARRDVGLEAGRITPAPLADARRLDLSGLWLLPGIVDIHGDGFERHLAPRRGMISDLAPGLRATEIELAAHGITTATLAQFWSWEGGMRGPDFARRLVGALTAYPATLDLRLQLRLEIACHADFAAVEALIHAAQIPYLVFNDHLPHRALAKGRRVPRLEGQALKAGRSPQAHQTLLQALYGDLNAAQAALPGLAARLTARGVRLGSHDDPNPASRAAWRAMGAAIAEFPLDLETARAAHAAGDGVILGAPNLVRGGSHQARGLRAQDAVAAGLVSALASDYHYPAMLGAAAGLLAQGRPIEAIWPLVSSGPADLLGLGDRGRIAPGLRADLIVTDPELTRVFATFAAGRPAYLSGPMAQRVLG